MNENKYEDIKVQNDKEILAGILNQINSFDSKAGMLISVIGIVFGLSLSLLSYISNYPDYSTKHVFYSIIFVLFVISSITAITFSVLVIIPRTSKEKKNNVNYYMDLCEMDYELFKYNSSNFYNDESIFFNQIKTNAIICKKKHKFLRLSILSLIPTCTFLLILIAMVIFF